VLGGARVAVEAVPDRHRDVEPDEVEQLQRPHRVAGSHGHAGVDVIGLKLGSLEHPDGIEQVREQQPVDHEPGLVRDLDSGLTERQAPRSGSLANPRPQPLR
jgi:hypothetical protein